MDERPSQAVLGFRPHTYWTAVVALTGTPDEPQVIARRRIDFAAGKERFVYHQAAEEPPDRGPALLAEVRAAVTANAALAVHELLAELQASDLAAFTAVVPAGTARLPERLEDILTAHSRIHAAEGNFYRDVVADGCEAAGLRVRRAAERDFASIACAALGVDDAALQARLKQMGAALGPPWNEDFKLATLAAWGALEGAA
jgi:hypothetical protein